MTNRRILSRMFDGVSRRRSGAMARFDVAPTGLEQLSDRGPHPNGMGLERWRPYRAFDNDDIVIKGCRP